MRVPLSIAGMAATTALVVGLGAAPVGAQALPTVTGEAVCDAPTGHSTYQLNWTVTNSSGSSFTVDSAVESGAWTGNVTINPATLGQDESGTGSDGPVPGDTVGTVTLTVEFSQFGDPVGSNTGEINLEGTCVMSDTTVTTAPTTSTTAAQAATVTPAFTG